MRRDNPRLLVNSEARRAERAAQGLPPYPLKVTITNSGDLDPDLKFWHHGGEKVVYCPDSAAAKLREALGDLAGVVSLGLAVDLGRMTCQHRRTSRTPGPGLPRRRTDAVLRSPLHGWTPCVLGGDRRSRVRSSPWLTEQRG
ncbi:hypothetical protein [Nonomuraea sp. NPDC005501]|uniref:hypothetical protein n=1 Tax=Nonomuraea sp. NPDC005501 TaxID=3156884 RepID=UPI0033BE6336